MAQIAGYLSAPSTISDHGHACCRGARAWLRGADAANSYRGGIWHAPTWLRKQYEWGPVQWPIHWCSVPYMKKLDCGGLAAVAHRLYLARGQIAAPVQLALRYPDHAAEQWSRMWEREGISARWITGRFCYHEGCGIIDGEQMLLWDPTENKWLYPPLSPNDAFGSVVALRVAELGGAVPAKLHWGGTWLLSGSWQPLAFDGRGRLTAGCI